MKNGSTVSLGTILWKVLNNPLATNLTHDEAAEYAVDCIKLLGAPAAYEDKTKEIIIKEHKGPLPTNIVSIEGVRESERGVGMRVATDTFHSSDNQPEHLRELTYEIKKGIIFTSFSEGCVEIAYRALPVDEEGYPLIVDEQALLMAIQYYILDRHLEPMWLMGKISDKAFGHINQERHFYMGSASNKLQMPTPDEMASLGNSLARIITNTNAHSSTFRLGGKKERIKQSR